MVWPFQGGVLLRNRAVDNLHFVRQSSGFCSSSLGRVLEGGAKSNHLIAPAFAAASLRSLTSWNEPISLGERKGIVVLRPRIIMAVVAVVLTMAAAPATADAAKSGPNTSSDATSSDSASTDILKELQGLKIPSSIANLPNGLPNGPQRNYGTPTAAPNKTCPFVGKVPVSLPLVNSPVGTSIPGMAGLDLQQPSTPSHVYSELCMSKQSLARLHAGHPPAVLLMVHGITYGTAYFDFPYKSGKYSTVNHLDQHGYATLNIDRLGYGRSDHPLSPLVNATSDAEIIHQLVQKLKQGNIGGTKFPHVGLVGHSYGTVTNWLESSLYNDTDINIGSGYSDRVNPVTAGSFIGLGTPAKLSPVTSNQPWSVDPGYIQPLPSARNLPQLYYPKHVEPGVVQTDTKLANTTTVGEIATFPNREYDGTHKNIRIPTFDIQGEYDIMTCGNNAAECSTKATQSSDPATLERDGKGFTDWQKTSFSSQACFRGAVVPDAAHDVALHKNANQFQDQVAYFADQAMGTNGQNAANYRKNCAPHGPTLSDSLPEIHRLVPPAPLSPPPVSAVVNPVLGAIPKR
jgi:pimeloyl-ACP methyl ester carboxylesterase